MHYYFFVILSAFLFALQFLCQQKYEEGYGTGLGNALGFSFYKGLILVVMMFCFGGLRLEFTWFTFLISGLYALCYILMTYFSLKAFSVANLSVYSVFTMLGGMLLPFVVGVSLYGEELTVFKVICCLLVFVSVLMNIQKGKGSRKAFLYYILVFTLNGSIAVISKVHESAMTPHTSPENFMLYSGVWTIIICFVWFLLIGEKVPIYNDIRLAYSFGNGFFNGIGDLLLLISLAKLDASVQYPLVTGGVMVFSVLISVIRREKIRRNEYLASIIAFVAAVMMAF